MSNSGKKTSINLCVPLAKDVLPKLAIKATLFILDKFERKVSRQEAVRVGKGFILFKPIYNDNLG